MYKSAHTGTFDVLKKTGHNKPWQQSNGVGPRTSSMTTFPLIALHHCIIASWAVVWPCII